MLLYLMDNCPSMFCPRVASQCYHVGDCYRLRFPEFDTNVRDHHFHQMNHDLFNIREVNLLWFFFLCEMSMVVCFFFLVRPFHSYNIMTLLQEHRNFTLLRTTRNDCPLHRIRLTMYVTRDNAPLPSYKIDGCFPLDLDFNH